MTPGRAFDANPDTALGAALRGALTPGAQDAFVARVLNAVDQGLGWRVLAVWARAGIAAAVAVLLLAGALGAAQRTARTTDVVIAASDTGATRGEARLFAAERPPDPGALFATFLDH
jgi:hypothetical protein